MQQAQPNVHERLQGTLFLDQARHGRKQRGLAWLFWKRGRGKFCCPHPVDLEAEDPMLAIDTDSVVMHHLLSSCGPRNDGFGAFLFLMQALRCSRPRGRSARKEKGRV